jgi:hypothetical protein
MRGIFRITSTASLTQVCGLSVPIAIWWYVREVFLAAASPQLNALVHPADQHVSFSCRIVQGGLAGLLRKRLRFSVPSAGSW